MYLLPLAILLYVFHGISSQDRGETCEFGKGEPGICRIIDECVYAYKLLYENEEKPQMCGWEDKTMVVCCPENPQRILDTGPFAKFFKGSEDGVISSKDMTCRYDGSQPLLCCPKREEKPQPPEPAKCPRLPWINNDLIKTPEQRLAWSKCLSYRRFSDVCVQDESNRYIRSNQCQLEEFGSRISAGTRAAEREFPHMAVLGSHNAGADEADIVWTGGGSLVSDKYILTAGHVLFERTHGIVRYALLGTIDKLNIRSGELFNIIRAIPHKKYTAREKHDDIALLELDRQVKFSHFIFPICLPVPGMSWLGSGDDNLRIIAGWGQTGPSSKTNKYLHKAVIYEVKNEVCETFENFRSSWINQTMLCGQGRAVPDKGITDTCPGDSGGPMMVINSRIPCSYAVRGVVSFGPHCGKGAPAIYTDVEYYLDWIVGTIWPFELEKQKKKSY